MITTNEFKVLNFYGVADGVTPLQPDFNLEDIRQKYITIKRIKVAFYTAITANPAVMKVYSKTADFSSIDNYELQRTTGRVYDLSLEEYVNNGGLFLRAKINDVPLALFNSDLCGFAQDFDVDNIFVTYPEKLNNLQFTLLSMYKENFTDPTSPVRNYRVKVLVECYLTSDKPATTLKDLASLKAVR